MLRQPEKTHADVGRLVMPDHVENRAPLMLGDQHAAQRRGADVPAVEQKKEEPAVVPVGRARLRHANVAFHGSHFALVGLVDAGAVTDGVVRLAAKDDRILNVQGVILMPRRVPKVDHLDRIDADVHRRT